jgi:hypothetical protein
MFVMLRNNSKDNNYNDESVKKKVHVSYALAGNMLYYAADDMPSKKLIYIYMTR